MKGIEDIDEKFNKHHQCLCPRATRCVRCIITDNISLKLNSLSLTKLVEKRVKIHAKSCLAYLKDRKEEKIVVN